jgi:hypothetical protein
MQSESPPPPMKNEVIKTIEETPIYEAQPTIPKQVDVPPTPTLEESIKISKPSSDLDTDTTPKGSISEILDDFVSNLDKKIGSELSNDLEHIQKRITEDIGYASILNPMSITIATLRATPDFLSPMEIEDVVKKINFWRKKINV